MSEIKSGIAKKLLDKPITAVHSADFPPVHFKCKCSSFCIIEFLLQSPLCLFWPLYSMTSSVSGQKDGGQSRVKIADKPLSGLISCLRVTPWCLALFHLTHSPLSQFCPPNPSGQSQLKEPHRFTQVPPFRHGLLLQKCLLAEHPRRARK